MSQINEKDLNPKNTDDPSAIQLKKVTERVERIGQSYADILLALPLIRRIGYVLLILFAFDIVALLAPPNFTNPVWEFQTMGQIIERIAVPLIAYALIFIGGRNWRPRWELLTLKFLSWGALIFGVMLLLMVPLGVSNTVRLDRQNFEQITTQTGQQINRIQTLKEELKKAKTEEQMKQLLSQLDSQGRTPKIESAQQLREVTKKISSFLKTTEKRLNEQAQISQKNQRIALFKNSVKWNLGALISGVLFIIAWRLTHWAR